MIKKVVLRNFLSHANTEIDFNGSTIAVVGENGHGKSALLEAIPYAYFGLGRETKEGMSRINGDGSHHVEVWEDSGVVISRGRKSTGAGYCEVRMNDALVSKGKEADGWIITHLGMDVDTFMLTAFFGLGDSYTDKILGVTPSVRLETLQDLAQVGPYRKFHSRAKSLLAESEKSFETAKARMEGAESALDGVDGLKNSLSDFESTLSKAESQFKLLKTERGDLQGQEEVYHAFVKERERVSVERKNLKSEISSLLESKESYEGALEQSTASVAELKRVFDDLSSVEVADAVDVQGDIDSSNRSIAVTETSLKLHEIALNLPAGEAFCPLCNQSISSDIVSDWELRVQDLKQELSSLRKTYSELVKRHSDSTSHSKKLNSAKVSLDAAFEEIEEYRDCLNTVAKDIARVESELVKKDARFIFLTEKLGDEYQGLLKKIEDVNARIDDCQRQRHSAEGSISEIKQALKRAEVSKKVVSDSKAVMKKAKLEGKAAALLRDAWSRYGIPLKLVENVCSRIEHRATSVYQEFDSGRIEVREVEDRGKPGVQFYLVDRKGDRTYSQLSMGEKVMFFVAIRVAVAYIVAEDSPISVDFLVLDEAMGNLSPKRRDDMVRLINKALRKMFPQVILVTHTTIPEIFDRSIEVAMHNDVSQVRVI